MTGSERRREYETSCSATWLPMATTGSCMWPGFLGPGEYVSAPKKKFTREYFYTDKCHSCGAPMEFGATKCQYCETPIKFVEREEWEE